jgi:hypothetical protein
VTELGVLKLDSEFWSVATLAGFTKPMEELVNALTM